jgi:DMSO/TMAO reductase YedYZ molybdopterin-dependent catalytic subunit
MMSKRRTLWIGAGVAIAVSALLAIALLSGSAPKDQTSIELSVTGLVNNEVVITLSELKAMPSVTVQAELICVDGQSLGTHNWTGVRLGDILDAAVVQASAIKVAFFATGYSTDLTLNDSMRDDVIVAYLEDGAPMAEITRLVVPGEWGYKWISGLKTIELVDYNFTGKWESRGYPDDATIDPYGQGGRGIVLAL